MTTNKYGPKRILGNQLLFLLCQWGQVTLLSSPFPSSVVAPSFSQCLAPKQGSKNFPWCQARIKPRLASDVVWADRPPSFLPFPSLRHTLMSPSWIFPPCLRIPIQEGQRRVVVTSQSLYGFFPEASSPNPCRLRSGCMNLQHRAEASRQLWTMRTNQIMKYTLFTSCYLFWVSQKGWNLAVLG